jgi:hypothetical protein
MRKYTKGVAIALLLSGTALATAGLASAHDYYGNDNYSSDYYGNDNYRGDYPGTDNYRGDYYGNDYYGSYRPNGVISFQFGDVATGYRDGYWDNNRSWHHWNNDGDYRTYRYRHANTFRDWNHDRDGNYGWEHR